MATVLLTSTSTIGGPLFFELPPEAASPLAFIGTALAGLALVGLALTGLALVGLALIELALAGLACARLYELAVLPSCFFLPPSVLSLSSFFTPTTPNADSPSFLALSLFMLNAVCSLLAAKCNGYKRSDACPHQKKKSNRHATGLMLQTPDTRSSRNRRLLSFYSLARVHLAIIWSDAVICVWCRMHDAISARATGRLTRHRYARR